MQSTKQKSIDSRLLINRLFIVLRGGFGLVFVFSGGIKLTHLTDFSDALSNFGMIPEQLISPMAILIPVTEILIGAAILFGLQTAQMPQLAVALLVLFTAVIAVKLSEGAEISCACFGPLSNDKISEATVLRNLALLFWGTVLTAYSSAQPLHQGANRDKEGHDLRADLRQSPRPSFWKNVQRVLAFVLVFFMAIEVVLLVRQNRELKSRLAMVLGNGGVKPGEVVPPFKVTRLDGEATEIGYDGVNTKTLLLVFSTRCGACERNLSNWFEIASELKQGPYRVIGISLDPQEQTKSFVLRNSINYSVFMPADATFIQNYKPY
jgi:uncharacterized membrane protein YphA (DoxX/SURF4 family)